MSFSQSRSQTVSGNLLGDRLREVSGRVPGMKGHLEEETTGKARVDWFNRLNKDSSYEDVNNAITDMLREAHILENNTERETCIYDIFKLWAYKRGCHKNGEGYKKMSYYYLLNLAQRFPNVVQDMLESKLYATYGIWKDMRQIIRTIHELPAMTDEQKYMAFHRFVVLPLRNSIMEQRSDDLEILDKWCVSTFRSRLSETSHATIRKKVYEIQNKKCKQPLPNLSNAGKFTVTEKGADNKNAYWFLRTKDGGLKKISLLNFLVRKFLVKKDENGDYVEYPVSANVPYGVYKTYRQNNTKLRAALSIVEADMAGNRWDLINLQYVPCRAKFLKDMAFLNEKLKSPPTQEQELKTGNRFPEDEKRVLCRENTLRYFETVGGKMSTNGVYPHEIAYQSYNTTSRGKQAKIKAMWNAKVSEYRKRLSEIMCENDASTLDSTVQKNLSASIQKGNFLAVADVSGSMTWGGNKEGSRPLDIATGLTAFMSEVASPAFRNLAITFTDRPFIYNLSDSDGNTLPLKTRMERIHSHVGYNTNFLLMNKVLSTFCEQNHISEDDLPIITLFTDEGWDMQMKTNPADYKTMHERIIMLWKSCGYTRIPTYVYWNLRANSSTKGFQTKADFPGVMFLQGSSPNLFNLVLYGEMTEQVEKEVVIDGTVTKIKVNSITPYQNFRNAMDQDEFFEPLFRVLTKNRKILCV